MEWLAVLEQIGDAPFKMAMLTTIYYGVRELAKMRKSVEKLNIGMATVAEKVHGHDRRISNLERKKK